MSGAMESISGCQYIPIQSSASRWTNGLHVCSPQLSRANPLEEHKHLLTQRLEQRTKKRQPLGRKLREVLVIVLQDYPEIELSHLSRQCLGGRIAAKATLINKVQAWNLERNERHAKAYWQFTTDDARVKLRRLYPIISK